VRAAVLVGVLCALPACSFRVGGHASDGIPGLGDDAGGGADQGAPSDGGDGPADASMPGTVPDLSSAGFLSVTSVASAATFDLTQIGTADWVHWGTNSVLDVDRKAGGNQISDASRVAGSTLPSRAADSPITFTWSDGVDGLGHNPTSSGTDSSIFVTNGGFTITAPADKTRRRLFVYVGLYDSQAQMRITLSDGSADPYNDTMWQRNNHEALGLVYTIDYSAAGNNQTVTVTWTLAKANADYSIVGIGSAALTTP
jgi:hypothetical protein